MQWLVIFDDVDIVQIFALIWSSSVVKVIRNLRRIITFLIDMKSADQFWLWLRWGQKLRLRILREEPGFTDFIRFRYYSCLCFKQIRILLLISTIVVSVSDAICVVNRLWHLHILSLCVKKSALCGCWVWKILRALKYLVIPKASPSQKILFLVRLFCQCLDKVDFVVEIFYDNLNIL